ncbi:MAG: hypothetical protein AAFO07_06345 [Bacteroidota bacterium]
MKNTLLSLIILLAPFSLLADDSWPQPKKSGYIKLSQWWLTAREHYTDQRRVDPNVTNGLYFTSVYGEYGLTDKLTGIVYFPFFARNLFNNSVSATTGEIIQEGEAINSIGDIDISFRYNLVKKGSFVLSALVQFGIPTGMVGGGSDGALQTGDGEFNQALLVELGQSFRIGNTNAFAKAYFGVNNRTEGFSDEFRFGVETGATVLNEKVILIARLSGVESFNNGTLPSEATGTSIFANNTEFLIFGPEIGYKLTDQLGVSFGIGEPLSGRLIFANTSFNAGVFYQW